VQLNFTLIWNFVIWQLQSLVTDPNISLHDVFHFPFLWEFSMRALASYQSCLVRQVNEAVRIGGSKAECIMNSKAEFHQAPLVRVVPVVGLEQEQGEREERRSRVGRGGWRNLRNFSMFCCAIVVSFLPSKFCPPLPFALMCPAFAARYLEAPSNLSSIALCTYVSSFCCPVFGGQYCLFPPFLPSICSFLCCCFHSYFLVLTPWQLI